MRPKTKHYVARQLGRIHRHDGTAANWDDARQLSEVFDRTYRAAFLMGWREADREAR